MKAIVAVAVLMATIAFTAELPETAVPRGWTAVKAHEGEIEPDMQYSMTMALKRRNMDKLDKIFWEVSDPRHANYGEHLNHDQVRELVSPGPEALQTVTNWLHSNGIAKYTIARHEDSIAFEATLEQVSRLLSIRFRVYQNKKTGVRVVKSLNAMTVPDAVAQVVELISGHRGFPLPKFQKKHETIRKPLGSPETNVTPATLYSSYNMSYFPSTPTGKKNIQSFFQAQGQYVEPSDLKTFCNDLDSTLGDCKITKYIGPNQGSMPGLESSLDSEYITATGRATETWVYSYSNVDFCGDLMRWAQDVFAEKDGTYPWVISMSYGSQSLPNYCLGPDVERLSKDIQKMGAMGITVVIASGDSGSAEDSREGYNYGLLAPSMPASIPYCTAVGSTTFISGDSGAESAVNSFGSGGGFSFDYGQPSYQTEAVQHFFSQNHKLPPHLSYNGSGRGTPDVSTLGSNFWIISEGFWQGVSGTSCSTPTFAGMVTMLNNIRLQSGKTLGFLNPLIYQNAQAFNDITVGNNDVNHDGYGWYCVPGWDPITGLGTPNWGKLADVVKGLNAKDKMKK